jgi:CubicO group peptidase (beta-lactamase class C family)
MNMENALPRSTPEAQGISSTAIDAFIDAIAAAGIEMHSFMLLRHGKVLAEGWWRPFAAGRPHMLYSLSKSFTSSAAGLAVEEGLITLDDKVVSFFPNDLPGEVSENLAKMRVRDLLSMSTGHAQEPRDQDTNWSRTFLAGTVEFEPGTHFLYNSGATYMVSAVLQKVTGITLTEYLRPRLFEPLGIENPRWEQCPRGIDAGGWGLNITTEDVAKFGQLYLQKGRWDGMQLIPESWIDQATSKQISNGDNPESDWNQGYGFQFWMCRHGAYRGDGAFGQYCVVMPDQDAVFAATSGTGDLQGVLNVVWNNLLSAMSGGALPENGAAQDKLLTKLASLEVPTIDPAAPSALAREFSGKKYQFDDNEDGWKSVEVAFGDASHAAELTIVDGDGPLAFSINGPKWTDGGSTRLDIGTRPMALQGRPDGTYPCVVAGAWTGPRTYVAKICGTESPYTITLTLTFGDNGTLTLDRRANVAFGPTERPLLTGRSSG